MSTYGLFTNDMVSAPSRSMSGNGTIDAYRLPDDYPCQQFHRDLTNVYLGSQVNKEQHELHPFLEFLNALSQRSKSACQAILEARLLDMFVYMFARDFSTIEITDDTSTGSKFSMHTKSSILEISRTMITTLSSHRSTYAIIRDHPFRALCPREYLPDTFPPLEWRWIRRQLAWNGYPESLWDDRLRMIAIIQSKPQEHKGSDTDDLYADIIHFCRFVSLVNIRQLCLTIFRISRSNPCRGGVSASAVVEAISLMMRGGPHCDMLLSIMSKISYQSNADALENIIKFLVLLRYVKCHSYISQCLILHVRRQQTGHRTFTIDQSRPTRGFMAYAIEAAKHSESIRDALLDADIARLLLYAISDTTRHSIVLPDSFKLGDPSSMILFSALVRSMAKSAEKTRLKAIGLNSWRATLRHAVDLFLLCDDFIANEDYQECRAHLYTILEDTAAT